MSNLKNLKKAQLVALVTAMLGATSFSAQAYDCNKAGVIEVNGQSRIEAMPDVAIISVNATFKSDKAKKSKDTVEEQVNSLIKKVTALGVDKDLIKAQSISVYPTYHYTERKRIFDGYVANRFVSIELKDFDLIDKVNKAALDSGISEINSVDYQLKDNQDLIKQAQKLAIADAKKKAQVLAEGFDVKLGKPCLLKFGYETEAQPIVGARLMKASMMDNAEGSVEGTYTPQKQVVESKVYAKFSIDD